MPKKDYYKLLGVSKDASTEEIKSALRSSLKSATPILTPGIRQRRPGLRR